MPDLEPSVIIAGAGPVGLALAVGLGRHGVRALVLEQKPALSKHSKAPGVLTRTLEVLRGWGLLEHVLAQGTPLQQVGVYRAADSVQLATIDLGVLAEETATPGLVILPQNDMEALLLHGATRHGLASVRFGHRLAGFRQDAEGVTVRVEPAEGAPYELRAAYLVGCDGPHSAVREQLGWQLVGKTYPTRFMLVDVRLSDARNELPWPRISPMTRGAHGAVRLKPDLWRIISTLAPDEPEEAALSEPSVAARVEALFGAGPFERVWDSVFHIHCRNSPHFRSGRVLLAGDAAHLNSPAGGMGMNSGIQDAHNLAWKLARALDGGDAEALLASYEQERRPAVMSQVDRYTDTLTRLALLPAPRLRAWLGRAAGRAIAHPAVMRRLARKAGMLDTCYAHSALIAGSGRHLGCRAPDGEAMDGEGRFHRLHDMPGPEAVLLLFDDGGFPLWPPGQVENWVDGFPGLRVVRLLPRTAQPVTGWLWDAHGRLWEAWGAESGTAALIRPDGHVGWREARPSQEALLRGVERALGVAVSRLSAERA